MRKIRNFDKFISNNGINGFAAECYYRLTDTFYEKKFGVYTKDIVSKEKLGIDSVDCVEYCPIHYKHIIKILNMIPLDKYDSTLLDYGCGKGRILICALSCSYKKVIGIEISNLIDLARSNIKATNQYNEKRVELVQCNATCYEVPSDVNVIYFFNPFREETLNKVINNIHCSYQKTPRKIYIAYVNNSHFDKAISNEKWLSKIHQAQFYPHYTFGLYETK